MKSIVKSILALILAVLFAGVLVVSAEEEPMMESSESEIVILNGETIAAEETVTEESEAELIIPAVQIQIPEEEILPLEEAGAILEIPAPQEPVAEAETEAAAGIGYEEEMSAEEEIIPADEIAAAEESIETAAEAELPAIEEGAAEAVTSGEDEVTAEECASAEEETAQSASSEEETAESESSEEETAAESEYVVDLSEDDDMELFDVQIKDGFNLVGGVWGWYKNGKLQTGVTGLVKGTINGSNRWYYVKNGVFTTANGITRKSTGTGKWYYVRNGVFTRSYGIARKADGSSSKWYYVYNGSYKKNSGIAQKADGSSSKWYYVKNGAFNRATGIARKADGSSTKWYYVKNGSFKRDTGFAQKADGSSDKWYYVQNGSYKRATGLAKGTINGVTGWYYTKNGAFSKDTLFTAKVNNNTPGTMYFVLDGKYTTFTGVIDAVVDGNYGWWYSKKGKLDLSYNGTAKYGVRTFTIQNGKAVACDYYFPTNVINLPSGGYNLSTANIGLKVLRVNQKLLGSNSAYYTGTTAGAVSSFQAGHGLPVTGIVDLATWRALGYSDSDWYYLGTYVTPIKATGTSTPDQRAQVMVQTAREYALAGTAYNDGCSGAPGTYVDCSGLIFQCLYSAGINPDVNIVTHALLQYEYASRYLAYDAQLGPQVSLGGLNTGDLLFYANNGSSVVNHVAIYAGGGMIYDSYPGLGVTYRSQNIPGQYIVKATRPF